MCVYLEITSKLQTFSSICENRVSLDYNVFIQKYRIVSQCRDSKKMEMYVPTKINILGDIYSRRDIETILKGKCFITSRKASSLLIIKRVSWTNDWS